MYNFSVKGSEEGLRLDKFLAEKISGISKGRIKELIDAGKVRVNGKRVVIAKWEMLPGDEVSVAAEGRPALAHSVRLPEREAATSPPKRIHYIKVVYEDRDVIVTEKPAGVPVQAGHHSEETYGDHIREYLKRKYGGKSAHIKPVHRLDKETSGLMVFAKSRVGERLEEQFRRHNVERSYLAVVDGAVADGAGKIDLPISKGDFGYGRKAKVAGGAEGAHATTEYAVKERYGAATLLQLNMKTGRTHQARVHLLAINHPIIGDHVYGRPHTVKFGRHALHSHILGFRHPATGRVMRFRSDLPQDMKELVERLRGGQ